MRNRGYTLIEIIIVIGLIGVLSAVVIAKYQDFDSTTLLRSLAFEVALSVREAQIMTISTSNGTGSVESSYGVHFEKSDNDFVIFTDRANTDIYQPSQIVKTISLPQGASISNLCVRVASGCTNVNEATVTFDRPHLDTAFDTDGGITESMQWLEVTLTSRRGGARTVLIDHSSRIEVLTP